jgi:hypothetical protein
MKYNVGTLPGKLETNLVADSRVRACNQRSFPAQSELLSHRDSTEMRNRIVLLQKS